MSSSSSSSEWWVASEYFREACNSVGISFIQFLPKKSYHSNLISRTVLNADFNSNTPDLSSASVNPLLTEQFPLSCIQTQYLLDQNNLHSLSLGFSRLTSTVLVRDSFSASALSLTRIYSSSFCRNSAQLGMISMSSPKLSAWRSSSSSMSIQSVTPSSISPSRSSLCRNRFLQQEQRGFSSNFNCFVIQQAEARSGHPQKICLAVSSFFIAKICCDFSRSLPFVFKIRDQGNSPFSKQAMRNSNDIKSSFLEGVLPL